MKLCKKLKDREFDLVRQEIILATASFSEGGESAVIVGSFSGTGHLYVERLIRVSKKIPI